mmetsp:Transcript_20567/g.64714  ORF Transcript_20567/g.64714 Transcript_20567/m.64714 type:complete len:192 (+) Transcript_20567:312-887(+)
MAAQALTTGDQGLPYVVFETSIGAFSVELYGRHAPRTCKNFRELARTGYYDGTTFHRVIRGFMAQGGDPTGTGRGGESIYGGKFADEITRELKHVGAGVLAMANSGPNTNGSQFFLTLAPAPWLDGKHAIFGRVASGMGTVRKLGMVPIDANDRPTTTVTVRRAYPAATPKLPDPAVAGPPGAPMLTAGAA